MKEEIKVQSPTAGINLNAHESGLQEGEYFMARNSNIQSKDGGKYYLTSDPSNILTTYIKEGYKVVGRKSNYREDRTYLFLLNPETNNSEIGYIEHITNEESIKNESTYIRELSEQDVTLEELYSSGSLVGFKEYTTLIEDCDENPCLNFKLDKPIHSILIRNDASGTKISWTFGEMPMTLDLFKLEQGEIVGEDGCIDCKKLKVFREFNRIFLEEDSITEGELDKAQYQFYAAYCTEDGILETEYHSQTPIIDLNDVQGTIIDLTDLETTSGNGIKLKVSSIDEYRDFFKVAVAVTKSGGTRYYEVGVYSTDSDTVILNRNPETDAGADTRKVIQEIETRTPHYIASEKIEDLDGYLTHMNVRQHREINLQPVVNLMGLHARWATVEVSEDFYQTMIPGGQMTSAMRDETYPYAISFEMENGYETAKFPLIGRPANDWEVDDIINEEGNIKPGFDNIVNSILDGKNDCTTTDRKKIWQYLNTAEEEGIFPNYSYSNERAEGEVYKYIFTERLGKLKDPNKLHGKFPHPCTPDEEEHTIDYPFEFVLDSEVFGQEIELDSAIEGAKSYIKNYCRYREDDMYTDAEKTLLYLRYIIEKTESVVDGEGDNPVLARYIERPTLEDMGGECEGEPSPGETCCHDLEEIKESREVSLQGPVESKSSSTYLELDGYVEISPPTDCYINETNTEGELELMSELDRRIPHTRGPFGDEKRAYKRRPTTLSKDRRESKELTEQRVGEEALSIAYHLPIEFVAPKCKPELDDDGNIINESPNNCEIESYVSENDLKQIDGPIMRRRDYGRFWDNRNPSYPNIIFPDRLTKGAVWMRINPREAKGIVFKISRFINSTTLEGDSYFRDARFYRISFFKGSSTIPYSQEVVTSRQSFNKGLAFSSDLKDVEGFEDYTDLTNGEFVYVVIDSPIVSTWDTLSSGSDGFVYMTYPVEGCFTAVYEEVKEEFTSFEFEDINLDLKQAYRATCSYTVPQPDDCKPQAFKYGKFAYTESTEKYPNNKELYDSSNLKIKREHFERTRATFLTSVERPSLTSFSPSRTMREFEEAYTEGVDEDGNFKLKGTDFTKKGIRHFKYPDNSIAPLLPNYRTAEFSDTSVQPIGLYLDEKVIETYLDIAEYNGLLSKEERKAIVAYTIHIGDRTGEKTVISKGIAFDMYKYEEDREILFSNFPFNTLGRNNFILDKTNKELNHPNNSLKNDRFTVMTPETYLANKLTPTEVKVEGYMYGSSENKVAEIKDHSKQVVLGSRARSLATTLAAAEVITGLLMDALSGLETARVSAGFTFSANIPGVIVNAVNVSRALRESAAEVGKLRLQWLETFEAMGKPINFAYRTTGVGKYNYMMPDNQNLFRYKGKDFNDNVRGLLSSRKLDQTNEIVADRKGDRDYINNQHREESIFIKTGKEITYPLEYVNYDNYETAPAQSSRIAGTGVREGQEVFRNIASPYISLKNYRPGQYGKIGSVKWLNTGFRKKIGRPYKNGMPVVAFGGGVYIARVSEIRKASIFRQNFMDIGDRVPFEYSRYPMYGHRAKYYFDHKVSSQRSLRQFIMPSQVDKYVFDTPDSSSEFYVKEPSKFYMQSYGVIDYITETELNPFFRVSDRNDHKTLYYGQTKDYERLTEEKVRPIQTKNTFIYNPVYLRKGRNSMQHSLNSVYNKVESEYRTKGENTIVISQPNYSDFNTYDPWKVYSARDLQQFNNYGGKLKDIMALTSQQVMLRFENGLSILNPQVNAKKDVIKTAVDIIKSQKIEFTKSDTGHAGTENTATIDTEAGTLILDTKRGAVFLVNSSGTSAPNLQEISKMYGDQPTNMDRWFQENLPFHIKSDRIKNYLDININNNFNGIGISLGYDNIHKQILISKKDFVPLKNNIEYKDGEFYHEDMDISRIIDNMYLGEWEVEEVDYENKRVRVRKEREFDPSGVLAGLSIFVETRQDQRAIDWEYSEQGYETSRYIKDSRMLCTSNKARITGGRYFVKVNDIPKGIVNLTNSWSGHAVANSIQGKHPENAWGVSPYDNIDLDRYDELNLGGPTINTASGPITITEEGLMTVELTPIAPAPSTEDVWVRVFFRGSLIYSNCLVDGKTEEIDLKTIEELKTYDRKEIKIPGILYDPEYFEEASWTIAFNLERGRWTSFFDFIPDYYINTPRYFQTGINRGVKSSIWAHGMTNRSFNTYYGDPKEWGVEMPISFTPTDMRLSVVKYMMEAKRHQGYGYHNFTMNERIGMDRAIITGLKSSTGYLNLKAIETPWQRTMYPVTRPEEAEQDIAQTYSRGTWSFNMVADRLKEGSQIWRHNYDGNTKSLVISSHDYSRVQLKRVEDVSNKIYLTSQDTKHNKQLLISMFNESTKTDR